MTNKEDWVERGLTIFADQPSVSILLQTLLESHYSMDPRELQRVLPYLRAEMRRETTQSLIITLSPEVTAGEDLCHLQIAHVFPDRDVVGAPEFDKVHTTVPDNLHDFATQKVQQRLEVVPCKGHHVKKEHELRKGSADADKGKSPILHPQLFALLKEIVE